MDIIKKFPSAAEVRNLTPGGLYSYIFEERLKHLRKRILSAAAMGETEIKVDQVYEAVKEYLKEKGYTVTFDGTDESKPYTISWDNIVE